MKSSLRLKLMVSSLLLLLVMALVLSLNVDRALTSSGKILSERTQTDMTISLHNQPKAEAKGYSGKIATYINSTFQVPAAISSIIESSITSAEPLSRSQVSLLIKSQLEKNINIGSILCAV